MTDWVTPLTRRRLLGIATAGGLLYGGTSLMTKVSATAPTHTHYTYAQTGADRAASDGTDPSLQIAWRQEYNGEIVHVSPENAAYNETDNWPESPIEVAAGTSPTIDESDVLPGDEGWLHVGLSPEIDEADETDEIAAWFRPRLTNGGRLADAIEVELWYDTGMAGIGGCDGENGVGDESIGSGSLRAVFTNNKLATGARLGCLAADERLCLGFMWRLPETVGNEYQGAGVGFALDFGLTYCADDTSPFSNGGDS